LINLRFSKRRAPSILLKLALNAEGRAMQENGPSFLRGCPVRKIVIGVLADHAKVVALRAQGISWTGVAEHFTGNTAVNLTPEQAREWYKNGFAIWVGRRRMLITSNLEAFPRLHDLSARVGEYVVRNRKQDWVGPYLRGQFLKPERG